MIAELFIMVGCAAAAAWNLWAWNAFRLGVLIEPVGWIRKTEKASIVLGFLSALVAGVYFGLKALGV